MNSPFFRIALIAMLAATAALAFTLTDRPILAHETDNTTNAPCPSGKMTANLTGWTLNNMIPKGTASYEESTKQLKISLESVKLDDGTVLTIESDDDKIGEVTSLKDGNAEASINVADGLKEKDRIRIVEDERPIVSGNLTCAAQSSKDTP